MQETPTEPFFQVAEVEARRGMRRAVRLRCEIVSCVWDEPKQLPLTELSPYGAWVETLLPLHPGTDVVITFKPPGWSGREISAFARVRRIVTGRRRADRAPLGMGLELLDVDFDDRIRLAACMRGIPPRLKRRVNN